MPRPRKKRDPAPLPTELSIAQDAVELIKQLEAWIADLQSGMYINCVYCGHRYGPDPGTPVAMSDVLKVHIQVCPKHPASKLRDALQQAVQVIREWHDGHTYAVDANARNAAWNVYWNVAPEMKAIREALDE